MTISEQRAAFVTEARSFISTPYVHGARIKGVGVDCATLLYLVLRSQNLIPEEDIGIFSGDWWMHSDDEKYMLRIVRHAYKVVEAVSYRTLAAEPGNIVMTKAGGSKIYNHGAIITRWPLVVHAVDPAVEEIDASKHPMWSFQTVAVFCPFKADPK